MMRLLLVWIMGIGVMAGAEPLRVAVVDLTAVFNAHPDTAQAEALLERAVAAMKTTQERGLEQGFLAERRRILASISGGIGRFNADARYALILDNSAASANGLPQVLHAPGVDDVTE